MATGADPSYVVLNMRLPWNVAKLNGFDNKAAQVAVGRFHACALLTDGRVRCWGDNLRGALGGGDAVGPYNPPRDGVDVVAIP